jgi:hypothetical protein
MTLQSPIIIPVCGDLRIFLFSGGYSIVLHGDSYRCITIKIVSGIIHHYHTDKLVTGNNLYITYSSGHCILFSTHPVEFSEYLCILE